MKTCIVQSKKTLPDILANNEKYCTFVFNDPQQDNGWRQLLLEENEKIKMCDDIEKVNLICQTDGSWLLKTDRIKAHPSDDKCPLIVSSPNISYPFTKNIEAKKMYDEKKYDAFAIEIEKGIFSKDLCIFENYYAAVAYLFGSSNFKKGQERLVTLLSENKKYAEGWCMLGDILCMQSNWNDAIKAYEKALEYGSERDIFDSDPVWLSRYGEYPKVKLEQISKHLSNMQVSLRNVF